MSFQTEIEKLQRTRRAYLRFALEENRPDRLWTGGVDRRYGKVGDAQGIVPVVPTVSRFGTIQRSLANYLYSLEVPSVSIELFDPEREWHALTGGADDQITYRNLSLWLRVLDDVLTPYDQRVAVAQIRKPSFPSGGKVTLDCQVASGNFLGAKVPRRFITTEDFPNAPVESQGLPVPIIYGVRSNKVSTMAPPTSTSQPGGSDSDDPASLPPLTGGETVSCNDLWIDEFETGELGSYTSGAAQFTFMLGQGSLGSASLRSNTSDATLVKTVAPPRRSFCVEWSSDHDQQSVGTSVAMVEGVNIYRGGDRDIASEVPVAGQVGYIQNALIPGTRQGFKVDGVFATKNFAVTLAAPLTASATYMVLSLSDSARLRAGMIVDFGHEKVEVIAIVGTAVTIARSQFDSLASGILDTGTAGTTHDPNGFVRFWINDVLRFSLMDTELVHTASELGMWSRVALSPGGDADGFHIGSGIVYGGPTDGGGSPPSPAKVDCKDDADDRPTPSGAAVKAILVGTYSGPKSKDTKPAPVKPCGGHEPWGTAAKLAADLQEEKDNGTLMDSMFVKCIGRSDCQKIMDLDGPVPTTKSGLVDYVGHYELNCLLYGECGSGTRSSAASVDNYYVLAGHALKEITAVYVLKPVEVKKAKDDDDDDDDDDEDEDETEMSEPMQVKMTAGKDYTTAIRDINGHRYHLIIFNEPQISDTCEYFEVTANVKGIETNGNGTGTLLTNADDIFEHAMLNWILNSYQSSVGPYAPPGGPWFTDVPYAPDIWDHASVVTAKAVAASRVAGGYKGAGTLSEVIEAREWIREMLVSFDLEMYFNNNIGLSGAWSVCRFNPALVRASLPHWDAGTDAILKDSFGIDVAVEQMINVIPFFGGPTTQRMDAKAGVPQSVGGGGWRVSGEARSDASISRYGMAIAEPLYLKWSDDATTIGNVMAAYLRYQDLPPVTATFRMGLRALTSPLGSLIRLTHPDGIGSTTGWTEQVCKVIRSDIDLDRLVANVTVLSVDRLFAPAPPPVPPPTPLLPAGTIMVSGSGNDDTSQSAFLSPTGTVLGQPASAPHHAGLMMCRTAAGHIGTLSSDDGFLPYGTGLLKASDLTVLSNYSGSRPAGQGIAADAAGFWYTLQITNASYPTMTVSITKLDAASAHVATWDIPIGTDITGGHALAVTVDGLIAYCWLNQNPFTTGMNIHRVHKFSLAGAGSWLGQLTTDYNHFGPDWGTLLAVPDGSGDVLVSYERLNGSGGSGALRRYTPSGTLVWTAGVPAGATMVRWGALAAGLPSDTYFLAQGYDSSLLTYTSYRYTRFAYATGAPDNTHNFAPDAGDFWFGTAFVVLTEPVYA